MFSCQGVVNSGIPCVILRTGRTEGVDEGLAAESAVKVGAQGSLPPSAAIAKGQARFPSLWTHPRHCIGFFLHLFRGASNAKTSVTVRLLVLHTSCMCSSTDEHQI